jgi:crotonobetainyl-CoA:carnitine CoA-transferase CaiB-like acyl-CoA transferase
MNKQDFYRNARKDLTGPLHGIKVIEVTTTWAGPMSGCVLADYGADVIKIEAPTGEVGRRLLPVIPGTNLGIPHETVNRNKRNVTLDLHHVEGQELLKKLVSTADVFIENFRPGALAGWGLGYTDLRAVKEDLVYVSISGFGQFGDLHERAGYDPVAQNFSGWSSLNGDPAGGPTKAPTYLGDDLAGLHAALGTMAALLHRNRTGEGQHVDVALIDCLLFQSNGFPTAGALDVTLPRMGNQFSVASPVNAYRCSNGSVYAGVLLDTHWKLLARELERDDLAHLGLMERVQQRELLDSVLAEYCSNRTVDQVVTRCAELGIPATPINTYAEVARQPHLRSRDMLQDVELVNGQIVPLTGPAAKFSRTPVGIRQRAATLGEHTAEILEQLGCKPETIADLRARGVI